jgi:hypothetical protein
MGYGMCDMLFVEKGSIVLAISDRMRKGRYQVRQTVIKDKKDMQKCARNQGNMQTVGAAIGRLAFRLVTIP